MNFESHKQLLSRTGTISKHYKELSRISGSDFNIFKIINVSEDEVKHSAFLAELLNPKGSHGQGDTFLRIFTEKFGLITFNTDSAIVNVEKYVGQVTQTTGGRIDILIDDRRGNSIIIENKIYADDQDNQLIRYYNFKNQNLFYLTLNGADASEKSTTNSEQGIKLEPGKDYIPISYKSDILEWLELCQKEAATMPLLREGIGHYINLIKQLTGVTTSKAMGNEIIKLITESPTNLRDTCELARHLTEAKINLQWKFWEELKNAFIAQEIDLLDNDKTVSYQKVKNYYERKEKYYGLWIKVFHNDEISVHFGIELYDNIHLGFTLERNGQGGISENPENQIYRDIIKGCDNKYQPTKWFIGVQYVSPSLDFRNFNSDEIFKLTDKKEQEKIILSIVAKAKYDIDCVKKKLEGINPKKID